MAALTLACGVPGGDTGGGSSAGPTSADTGTAAASCRDSGTTFASDLRLARCLTEWYWTRRFAASGGTYRPVERFVTYNGDDGPSCGDQPSVPNNAFYCPVGHFIAVDQRWLKSLYDQLGDGAVYVIIPHEFGHAVQAQTNDNFDFNVERELQADCYAGGTLSGLIDAKAIKAEDGDNEELLANLQAAGDPTDAWWSPDAHGTAAQRTASFAQGFDRGVGAC